MIFVFFVYKNGNKTLAKADDVMYNYQNWQQNIINQN